MISTTIIENTPCVLNSHQKTIALRLKHLLAKEAIEIGERIILKMKEFIEVL